VTTVSFFDKHSTERPNTNDMVCAHCKAGLFARFSGLLQPWCVVFIGGTKGVALCLACYDKWFRIFRKSME